MTSTESNDSISAASTSPKLHMINYADAPLPKINLPFPPAINPQDLISLRESSDGTQKLPTRAPNAFIIYRKQFVKTARDQGHFLPMTVISSMASSAWENEKEDVKSEYRRIAKEAHLKRKAMYPKPNTRRRRKDRWNIVSFAPTNSNNNHVSLTTSKIPSITISTDTTNTINSDVNDNTNNATTTNNNILPKSENLSPDSSPVLTGDSISPSMNQNYYTIPPLYYYGNTFDPTSPNLSFTSFSDSSNSTSPNLDLDSTEQSTNNNFVSSHQEFNSIIEDNIRQNDYYGDWSEFNFQNLTATIASITKSNTTSTTASITPTTPTAADTIANEVTETTTEITPTITTDYLKINYEDIEPQSSNVMMSEYIEYPTNYFDANYFSDTLGMVFGC